MSGREDIATFAVARPWGRLEGKILEDSEPGPRKDDFSRDAAGSNEFCPLVQPVAPPPALGEERWFYEQAGHCARHTEPVRSTDSRSRQDRRRNALGDNDQAPSSSDYGTGDTAAEPPPSAADDHHARSASPGELDNSARRGALENHPVGVDTRGLRDA